MARPPRTGKGTGPRIVSNPGGDSDWQARYHMAVWRWFIAHGDAQPAAGSRTDPWDNGVASDNDRLRKHMERCAPDPAKSSLIEDTQWTEWGGTFSPDTLVIGMKVTITCRCGQVHRRSWQLQTSDMAALVNGLTSER